MIKRLLTLIIAVLMITGTVFSLGCRGGGEVTTGGLVTTPEEDEEYFSSFDKKDYPIKGDITVTAQMCGLGRAWLDDLAKNYEKITGIKVTVKESQDATEELTAKLSINSGLSDLYFDWSSCSLRDSWANKGQLVDLTDLVGQITPFKSDEIAPMNIYKDKYYTMPFAYQPVGFVYNQQYLDKIESNGEYTKGVWPKTWQGLLDLCSATQQSDLRVGATKVQPIVFGGTVKYTTYIFNGLWDQVDPEGFAEYWNYSDKSQFNKALLNTPSTVRVMQAMRDLFDPQTKKDGSYYPKNAVVGSTGINHTKAQTMFLNEAAVAVICGSWFENEMRQTIDEQDFYHFGGVPVLEKSNDPTAYINIPGEHFTVPTYGKNPMGGKQFLKFILQEQNIQRIHSITQSPLAYKYDTSKVKLTTWGKEINDITNNTRGTITFTDSDIMRSGALNIFGGEDPVISMCTKGISAEQAIKDEADYRFDNYDYYLAFIPKDNN